MEFVIFIICRERTSTEEETSEYFVDELKKTIRNEQILYELVHDANETSLFWRYVARKTS